MAIDNREKRQSAGSAGMVFMLPGVTPNTSKDGEWRQQAGWGYSGILVAVAILAIGEVTATFTVKGAKVAVTVKTPGAASTVKTPGASFEI